MLMADTLNTAEMGCLSSGVKASFLRVSDVRITGDVERQFPTVSAGGFLGVPPATSIDANWALAISFSGGVLHRMKHFLRGLPVDFFLPWPRAHYNWTPAWGTSLANFQTQVKTEAVIATRPKGLDDDWSFVPVDASPALPSGSDTQYLSIRRAGRPFGLPRGRKI
jgi:hypothetical protein